MNRRGFLKAVTAAFAVPLAFAKHGGADVWRRWTLNGPGHFLRSGGIVFFAPDITIVGTSKLIQGRSDESSQSHGPGDPRR